MNEPARVLVVGDAFDVETLLREAGYSIARAGGGAEALATARELQADLVLVDLATPGLDGLEVCGRMKADGSLPFAPVMLLAPPGGVEGVIAGFEAGADDCLTRPVDVRLLAARVRALLRVKARHDAAEASAREHAADLAESEARFHALVGGAGDVFFVFRPDGTIVDVDARACDTLLYDREELIGRSVQSIAPTLDPRTVDVELLRGSEATAIESELQRKDGYHFPVEVGLGLMDHRGELLVLALARDIRERKRAQAALREGRALRHQLEDELAVAHRIQMSLLPHRFDLDERADVHAHLEPAREVGGDFYDVFMLPDGRVEVVVGDVSGKGVSASLHMAITKTLISSAAHLGSGPAETLSIVNHTLCRDNDACMFVTIFIGILDPETGALTYASAGHNPPLLLRRSGEVERVTAPGVAAGIVEEAGVAERVVAMEKGDALLLYTDGVTEATSVARELFTEGRLREHCLGLVDQPSREIVTGVMREVRAFQMGAPQADDIAIVALRYI